MFYYAIDAHGSRLPQMLMLMRLIAADTAMPRQSRHDAASDADALLLRCCRRAIRC